MACRSGCTGDCGGCDSGCWQSGTGGCSGYCGGQCGGCGTCGSNCGSSCTQGCATSGCTGCGTCGGCGGCSGSCSSCGNGCSSTAFADIYTRLVLNTLIKAQDIIDLQALVQNETSRRNKTLAPIKTITAGTLINRDIIEEITTNLNKLNFTNTQVKNPGDLCIKSEIETYITEVKRLYRINV